MAKRLAFIFDGTDNDGDENSMTVAECKDGVTFAPEYSQFKVKMSDLGSLIDALKQIQSRQPNPLD